MWTDATTRASGGSRTRNPRITNAVLCQLKLRWHGRGEGSPAEATRKSSAPGVASSSQRIRRRARAELRHEPGVSDPAGASCQNGAGQGQDDRTVGPWAGDPGLGSWGRAGGPLITQKGMHVACQIAFFFCDVTTRRMRSGARPVEPGKKPFSIGHARAHLSRRNLRPVRRRVSSERRVSQRARHFASPDPGLGRRDLGPVSFASRVPAFCTGATLPHRLSRRS